MSGEGDMMRPEEESEEIEELIVIVGCSEAAIVVLVPGEEVPRIIPRSELSLGAIEFE